MLNESFSTASLHTKQWFHEEQEAKFKSILMFLVWWKLTLGKHLSTGGWLYKSKLMRLSCRNRF